MNGNRNTAVDFPTGNFEQSENGMTPFEKRVALVNGKSRDYGMDQYIASVRTTVINALFKFHNETPGVGQVTAETVDHGAKASVFDVF